jgi:hypothetical protein
VGGTSGNMLLTSVNLRFTTDNPATEAENKQIYGNRLDDRRKRRSTRYPDMAVKLMARERGISKCAEVTGSWPLFLFARALFIDDGTRLKI